MSNKRPRVLPTKRAIEKLYAQIDEEVDRIVAPLLYSPPPSPPTHRLCIRSERTVEHDIECNIRAMLAEENEAKELEDLRRHATIMNRYYDEDGSSSESSLPLHQPEGVTWLSQRTSAGNENDGYVATLVDDGLDSNPEDLSERGIYNQEPSLSYGSLSMARQEAEWEYIAHMQDLNERERPIRYVDGNREQRLYRRDEIVPAGNRGWLLPVRVNLDEDESYSDSSATIPL